MISFVTFGFFFLLFNYIIIKLNATMLLLCYLCLYPDSNYGEKLDISFRSSQTLKRE